MLLEGPSLGTERVPGEDLAPEAESFVKRTERLALPVEWLALGTWSLLGTEERVRLERFVEIANLVGGNVRLPSLSESLE